MAHINDLGLHFSKQATAIEYDLVIGGESVHKATHFSQPPAAKIEWEQGRFAEIEIKI
jgi:hypothetical protein